ncbi:MAG TPA: hypothetical protein VN873_05120 [Candidatus Angelobacter sp.]|nr:hypothetical protein [Candidatus Angelobacter sp.]
MDEPQNFQNTPRTVENDERIESLQRQNNLLFAVLLITSFIVTAYLGVEGHRASMDLMNLRLRAARTRSFYQQTDAANEALFQKLAEFSRTHPDFQKQIFFKYKLETNAPAAAVKK